MFDCQLSPSYHGMIEAPFRFCHAMISSQKKSTPTVYGTSWEWIFLFPIVQGPTDGFKIMGTGDDNAVIVAGAMDVF